MTQTPAMADAAATTADAACASLATLSREVDEVARYLRGLRLAINGLRVREIVDARLKAAQTDLVDVIAASKTAADNILDTAELLLGAREQGDAYRSLVEERMIALMEACSFQDLTGQRLDRVSKTILALDERLSTFAVAVKADDGELHTGPREIRNAEWRRANLVNGPGMPDALGQDSVDRMLRA
jgi:chemotaxis protein CheZ